MFFQLSTLFQEALVPGRDVQTAGQQGQIADSLQQRVAGFRFWIAR